MFYFIVNIVCIVERDMRLGTTLIRVRRVEVWRNVGKTSVSVFLFVFLVYAGRPGLLLAVKLHQPSGIGGMF